MNNTELNMQNQPSPELPPPKTSIGVLGWLRKNLFSSWVNTIATIVFAVLAFFIIKGTTQWIFFSAEWRVIVENLKLIFVGQYPTEHLWRVWVSLSIVMLLFGASAGMWKGTIFRLASSFVVIYLIVGVLPFISSTSRVWLFANIGLLVVGYAIGRFIPAYKKTIIGLWVFSFPIVLILLNGFGTDKVGTNLWGGFLLTVLIAAVSIVASFPIGVLLALGRRSSYPVIKYFSIGFIEFIRGVPLITILFVAQIMLPLFLGEGIELDNVIRAMVGFTLFNSAYIAENVRGGLQSLPKGQYEAAQALGLNSTLMMTFVVLPQALRAVIPAMVGQFISIFKDTVLVMIVGLIDLLGIGKKIVANPEYLGTQMEVYVFVAFIFLVFCSMMSYASRQLETSLGVGKR